jgi:hypothetical protein
LILFYLPLPFLPPSMHASNKIKNCASDQKLDSHSIPFWQS